jgi:hypothetical protein
MAKKKNSGSKHVVRAELSNFELAKAKSALTLKIFSRGKRVGELQVGRGSLFWWGARQQKGRRVRWGKFADMMDQLAYGKKARARRAPRKAKEV